LTPFDKSYIVNFIKNKLSRPKNNSIDLYTHNELEQETFDELKNNFPKDKRNVVFKR